MEHKPDLSGWTNPDLSLPKEPAAEPEMTCLGCGAPVAAGEAPPCGH